MKTQTNSKKCFVMVVFLALLLFNGSALRCEDKSNSINPQSRLKYAEKRVESINDPEVQNDKSRRYEELEWLIMQALNKQYQRMEEVNPDDLAD